MAQPTHKGMRRDMHAQMSLASFCMVFYLLYMYLSHFPPLKQKNAGLGKRRAGQMKPHTRMPWLLHDAEQLNRFEGLSEMYGIHNQTSSTYFEEEKITSVH